MHMRASRNTDLKLIRMEVEAADGRVEVDESFCDLRRQVAGGPQAAPFEGEDLAARIIPDGPSPMDRAYAALSSEMRARHPSLFR